MTQIHYRTIQLPPSITRHAVWTYVRFDLSLHDVEVFLAERGIEVSYKMIRR